MANIKLGGTTAITESGGTVTLSNGVQDNITRLGTVASGAIDSGVTFPAGHIIKTDYFNSSVRLVLAAGTVKQLLTNFITFNKSLSSTDLYIQFSGSARTSSNGYAAWWMRANSSTWREAGGMHQHATQYALNITLGCKIPAGDTTVGDNTIDISWLTNTGKPFDVWNPDSSDHAEMTGGTSSSAIVWEVVV